MVQDKPKRIWLTVGLVIAGLVGLACVTCVLVVLNAPRLYDIVLARSSLRIGAAAPDFELTALTEESMSLSQYRGQPVLLSFGASWCPDCRREAPLLQQLHVSHPELVILMVDSSETTGTVQSYVDEVGFTFPVLLDPDGRVNEQYDILAIPTELFIDDQGVIRAKVVETVTPQLLADSLPLIGIQP